MPLVPSLTLTCCMSPINRTQTLLNSQLQCCLRLTDRAHFRRSFRGPRNVSFAYISIYELILYVYCIVLLCIDVIHLILYGLCNSLHRSASQYAAPAFEFRAWDLSRAYPRRLCACSVGRTRKRNHGQSMYSARGQELGWGGGDPSKSSSSQGGLFT